MEVSNGFYFGVHCWIGYWISDRYSCLLLVAEGVYKGSGDSVMWAWVVKLISGWLPIGTNSSGDKKPFGEYAGKLIWVIGIVVACMAFQSVIEHFFPSKPNQTNIESGGTQIIYQDQRDVAGFGCNAWRMYIRSGIKQK